MATLLDLGTQPLVNNLCASAKEAIEAERFPLRAVYENNLTIHLDTEVSPQKLYANYLYRSGVNRPYFEHCKKLYQSLSHLNLSTVIDVGGNDGTLLQAFREASLEYSSWSGIAPNRYVNVDMSESLRGANEQVGNEFVCGQFNEAMNLPKANLIVSTNVFQHTKDIHAFLGGIVKFLDGVWVLEFPYALNTLTTLQFDQFYHEHYYYWLVSPLATLFKDYGLKIIHAQQFPIHGGTMRLWMTNKAASAPAICSVIDRCKAQERQIDFDAFQDNCLSHIERCQEFLASLKGRTVFFGAAAKGCVFLNALQLTIDKMPDTFIIDDTVEKQGLFVPGTGFEIKPRRVLEEEPIDNIIVLAHNFVGYIAPSLLESFDGSVYTMLPSIAKF